MTNERDGGAEAARGYELVRTYQIRTYEMIGRRRAPGYMYGWRGEIGWSVLIFRFLEQ